MSTRSCLHSRPAKNCRTCVDCGLSGCQQCVFLTTTAPRSQLRAPAIDASKLAWFYRCQPCVERLAAKLEEEK